MLLKQIFFISMNVWLIGQLVAADVLPNVYKQEKSGDTAKFLKKEAAQMYRRHTMNLDAAIFQPETLRETLRRVLRMDYSRTLPLDYRITGETQCEGYKVLNVYYQSRPGFYVTGNLYVPDGAGPFPAVINLHGHWSKGRLAERVQTRGHLLAMNRYVCLSVDAFGSGERSTAPGQYEYHGGLLGGSLLNSGETLMGIQLTDNMRGIDLLTSLPYVDSSRIGATGASGGGNQTMYLAAMDTRVIAAMPVVSVGTFESYIMSHNCVCELMPGGLTFTEESGILALIASRALRICNGMQDTNPAFQVSEMKKSLQAAQKIYAAYGAPEKIDCAVYDIPHGYHPEFLREMLGFFDLHLKQIGDGKPWNELPFFQVLPLEKLLVFPSGVRPAQVPSIAGYLVERNASLRRASTVDAGKLRQIFRLNQTLTLDHIEEISAENGFSRFILTGSDGRTIPVLLRPPREGHRFIVIAAPGGKTELQTGKMWAALTEMKDGLAIIDLWGCGENDHDFKCKHQIDMVSRSLIWLDQTLQGKWIEDYRLTECFLMKYDSNAEIAAAGINESTVAATAFGAMRAPATALFLENVPDSLEFENVRKHKLNMAMLIPGILEFYNIDDLWKAAGGPVEKYD